MESSHKLSNSERENILTWTADDETIHVTAEIPLFRRLLERRGYKPDSDGFFRIPIRALSIRRTDRPRKPVSPEKSHRRMEHLRKIGKERVRGRTSQDSSQIS